MSMRAITLFAALAGTVALAGAIHPTPHGSDDRVVGLDLLHRALSSRPLGEGPMRDEVDFYESRLASREEDPLARRRLASLRLLRFRAYNRPDELAAAEGQLRFLEDRYPRDAGVAALRASLEMGRHQFPRALEASSRSARWARAGDEGARMRLFDVKFVLGDYEEAEMLLRPRPDHPASSYLSREARILDRTGDLAGAIDRLGRVVRMADAYAQPAVVRAWARVELAKVEFHARRYEDAVGHFQEALALVPGDPGALEGLGWLAYAVDDQLAVAEALFLRSLRYGGHLDLYRVLRDIALLEGDAAASEGYRDAFLREARTDAATERLFWRPLALTLAEDVNTLPAALVYAQEDLAQRQDQDAYAVRGWVLHRMGRAGDAEADMARALDWGVPEPTVAYLAGMAYLDGSDPARGRKLLRRALAADQELGLLVTARIRCALGEVDGLSARPRASRDSTRDTSSRCADRRSR